MHQTRKQQTKTEKWRQRDNVFTFHLRFTLTPFTEGRERNRQATRSGHARANPIDMTVFNAPLFKNIYFDHIFKKYKD